MTTANIATEILGQNAVLIAAASFSGKRNTKDTLQKRLFFLAEVIERDFGYRAQYYGPFSADVDTWITLLKTSGLLREIPARLPDADEAAYDELSSQYELTEEGEAASEWLRTDLESDYAAVEGAARRVITAEPDGFTALELASAAKAYSNVRRAKAYVTPISIMNAIKQFEWSLTETDSRHVLYFLDNLRVMEEYRPALAQSRSDVAGADGPVDSGRGAAKAAGTPASRRKRQTKAEKTPKADSAQHALL